MAQYAPCLLTGHGEDGEHKLWRRQHEMGGREAGEIYVQVKHQIFKPYFKLELNYAEANKLID